MKEKEKKELLKQERKNKEERNLFQRILNIVLWIVVVAWMAVCITDYIRVQSKKDPVFCIKKETIEYDTGNVYSCLGAGYRVYDYNRPDYKGFIFGPFWIDADDYPKN